MERVRKLRTSDNSALLDLSMQQVSTQANSSPRLFASSQVRSILAKPFSFPAFPRSANAWKETSSSSHIWDRMAYFLFEGVVNPWRRRVVVLMSHMLHSGGSWRKSE